MSNTTFDLSSILNTHAGARLLAVALCVGALTACQSGDQGSISGDQYSAYSETVPDYHILDDEAAMANVQFDDAPAQAVEELQIKVVSYSTAAEEASKCGIFLAEISEWGAMNCGRD